MVSMISLQGLKRDSKKHYKEIIRRMGSLRSLFVIRVTSTQKSGSPYNLETNALLMETVRRITYGEDKVSIQKTIPKRQ